MQQELQSSQTETFENSAASATQINASALVEAINITDNGTTPPAVPSPQTSLPLNKNTQRAELGAKFVPVRCGIESQASAAVNAKHRLQYKGTFEVRLDNPNEVTAKTLEKLCSSGALIFMPDDVSQYPALKRISDADGEVNLSAQMTKAKRPANIDDASWVPLEEMWNDVSKTLRIDGLAPMHMLIARVLAEKGLGGPKISKKLGGSSNAGAGHKHEAMCQVLDNLNELLMKTKATK